LFNRFIIYFFYFYLTSRFFSETLDLFPKLFDLLDLPVIAILGIALIFPVKRRSEYGTDSYILKSTFFILFICFLSILLNLSNIFYPSALLFVIANIGGPVLFLSLDYFSKDKDSLSKRIEKMIVVLLVLNIIIVVFVNIPEFLLTGNPDLISGTYGRNAYQFSILLIISGTYFLAKSFIEKRSLFYIFSTQFVVFSIFYLMQYRAALPFFVISYLTVIFLLYKSKVLKFAIPISLILIVTIFISEILVEKAYSDLDYGIWLEILSEPTKYLQYGKAISFIQTFQMLFDNPEYIPFGCGPGNFLSRAFYTFGWDLVASFQKNKGVGMIISQLFGMNAPRFTDLYLKYISVQTGTGTFHGTNQLSSPHVSILANLAEIGVFGATVISLLYGYIIRKSIEFFRYFEKHDSKLIPMSIALVASSVYMFLLGFIDIYYEVLRMTLPIWLIFWLNYYKYNKLKNNEFT
jgi:hypothetical protein